MTNYAEVYGRMHESGKRFPGYSLGAYVDIIGDLIEDHELFPGDHRILDYGSGKGYQYLARRYHERWPGAILPHCYDIGVGQLSAKPTGRFEGVICTDMLEHIEKTDIRGILGELVGFVASSGFLFLGISCRPTRKRLPDGRDVHLTIEHPDRWVEWISAALAGRADIDVHVEFDLGDPEHFPGAPRQWKSRAP